MIKYHRAQIREFFGFRENTVQDSQEMSEWLCQHILHHSQEWEHVKDTVYGRFRELCRHPDPIRYALLCAFFWLRSQEITDNLVDLLLVQIIHRISVRAERPDYAYLKSLFQHLRTELEIEVPKASKKLPYVPTEEELKRYYEVVWKSKNFQDMMIVKTLMYTGIRVSELINIRLTDID